MTPILSNWFPPSRDTWQLLAYAWQFFPIMTVSQWIISWYPQGKTSVESHLNLPGRYAWCVMEMPGFLTVLYCMLALPPKLGFDSLPTPNWALASCYTIHYIYRAIISPLVLNPSMSPIHTFVFLSAFTWQMINGLCLGGWLGGYGPTTAQDWAARGTSLHLGLAVWACGFLGNVYHDQILRDIRVVARRQASDQNIDKHYEIPTRGWFRYILYPHYLCEWIEWAGFWLAGGSNCVPARSFVLNEISTMLPRALQGRRWYIARFGREVGHRKAVLPGIL
ncbi:3-oxo-5-alpha-steroid 4-dehydrogenase-like protein [Piedraia hortae CBS 480.64]|uniref:3-oxo-5-alpha-steroid 4-dehydrogenase-like protein n=1 Tax=Piedraia hortae CBS 480.64 TaxID=1314780 RepID=A0A6A7CAK8_9PEZI|nr:3-oxo-5-alpha-steroid 4-dehydrogenase-like protein [Piedraia hortae CBS 480.64]